MVTIYTQASQSEVEAALSNLPELAMSGSAAGDAMLGDIGKTVLGLIRRAFLIKITGGTDEAGDRWPPLKPETIAYNRRHRRKEGSPQESQLFSRAKRRPWMPPKRIRAGYAPSYALTRTQRARWWDLYRKGLSIFEGGKGAAARFAWSISKREGATTIIAQYGDAKVDILRDTGLLLNSLSPGATNEYQVFRVLPGCVTVGTNRPGAGLHHRGIPNRLPQRRLWPAPSSWSESWWHALLKEMRHGVILLAKQLIGEL